MVDRHRQDKRYHFSFFTLCMIPRQTTYSSLQHHSSKILLKKLLLEKIQKTVALDLMTVGVVWVETGRRQQNVG